MTNTVIQEKLLQLKKHIEYYIEHGAYPSKREDLTAIVKQYIDHLEVLLPKYDDVIVGTIAMFAKRQGCMLSDDLQKEGRNYKIIIVTEDYDYTTKLSEKRIYTKEKRKQQQKLKGAARWEFIRQKRMDGYTLREIAELLGMNYSSLRVWISRNQEKYDQLKIPVYCMKCRKKLGEIAFLENNVQVGEIKLLCQNCFL